MKPAEPPPYGMQPPPSYGPPPACNVPPTYPVPYVAQSFGPERTHVVCPHCHSNVTTTIKKEATTKTHLFALLLCIIFCPCVCLPYCCDSCQATNHYCPKCNAFLGYYDN